MHCLLVSRILSTNESDGFDFLVGAANANFFNSFNFRMTFMKQDKNLTTMRKVKMLLAAMLMPLAALAQTVTSPDGNVVLNFSLDNGRPTYQLDYKGKAVVKPSHLGLELAKDKHASKGLEETDLMDGFTIVKTDTSSFDETWKPVWGETATIRNNYKEYGERLQPYATTTRRWPLLSTNQPQSATSSYVSACTMTAWACATSSHSRTNSTIS